MNLDAAAEKAWSERLGDRLLEQTARGGRSRMKTADLDDRREEFFSGWQAALDYLEVLNGIDATVVMPTGVSPAPLPTFGASD